MYISHVKSAGLAAVKDHILPFKLFLLTHFNRDPDDHFSPVLVIEVSSIFNFLYSESETTTEVKSLEKQVTKRESGQETGRVAAALTASLSQSGPADVIVVT